MTQMLCIGLVSYSWTRAINSNTCCKKFENGKHIFENIDPSPVTEFHYLVVVAHKWRRKYLLHDSERRHLQL